MDGIIESCPQEVQDMICQTADEVSENYTKVNQRVVSSANKAAANGPTPMDIGEAKSHRCKECDVGAAASSLQCYNCGGWGHASRNCPPERKGSKGGKGGGQGKGNPAVAGKGTGKGPGRGDKGKGFQRVCFNRGKSGHRAWECLSKPIGASAGGRARRRR